MRKGDSRKKNDSEGLAAPDVSRRNFITKAAIGAGATAASMLGTAKVVAASDSTDGALPIRIPDEFTLAANVPLKRAEFPMTGAEVFARVCKDEGLGALFCCPGNYHIQNAIAMEGIPTYSGIH